MRFVCFVCVCAEGRLCRFLQLVEAGQACSHLRGWCPSALEPSAATSELVRVLKSLLLEGSASEQLLPPRAVPRQERHIHGGTVWAASVTSHCRASPANLVKWSLGSGSGLMGLLTVLASVLLLLLWRVLADT